MTAFDSHEQEADAVHCCPGPNPHPADRVAWLCHYSNIPNDFIRIQIAGGSARPFAPALAIDRSNRIWDLAIKPPGQTGLHSDEHATIAPDFAIAGRGRSVAHVLRFDQLPRGDGLSDCV